MPIIADLLTRKNTHFVLWLPHGRLVNPALVIGQFQVGNPPSLGGRKRLPLTQVTGQPELWDLAASACGLTNGQVYHYWFEVPSTHPDRQPAQPVLCTDPTAFTVDWRLVGPQPPAPFTAADRQPAAVILFQAPDRLVVCDPGGEQPSFGSEPTLDTLPPNNRLVIYELPTAWTRSSGQGTSERGVGTFRDVRALVDPNAGGANFEDLAVTAVGRSYLTELGINAIELLPPADSAYVREWGYGTSHFFAPDHELGFPDGNASPTANVDLSALVGACHRFGIRFFVDVVMAFARDEAYQHADFEDFYIANPAATPNDPDALTSGRAGGRREFRNGFGSTLFRYARFLQSYDPIGGNRSSLSPSGQLMRTALARWMRDFQVDGVRMDSVENVANWDFVRAMKDDGRRHLNMRWTEAGLAGNADARYLTIGEELELPPELFSQNRIDALWNDAFRARVRAAVMGEGVDGNGFEETVRQMIECVRLGFSDGARAINYITSHDVEGVRKERLFNMLRRAGVSEVNKRIQLAFTCLLTAVGIPMILAGEEFADEHDLFDSNGNVNQDSGKQVDPVNFSRQTDPWRTEIFNYAARLVQLRTSHPALAVNDTNFIHVDFEQGKRVLVWRRGQPNDPVVVVANFSDFSTDTSVPNAEYVVPNWPVTPPGCQWRCVSQGSRVVSQGWVGREPIFSWEAKVYALTV